MHDFSKYDDEQLVGLLTENDETAFSEIYGRYWKPLYISVQNILHDTDPSQDIVQEVFISLWQRRDTVQVENLKAYLFQAVRFQVFKYIRADKAQAHFYDRLAAASREIEQQDPILHKEMQAIINNMILTLPEDQREIFMLHRTEGLTYSQIAERKNISIKTVEKKMSLALRHLRPHAGDAVMLLFIAKNLY
jgi:RNA polymerase sigma-70 factor (family 1)